MWAAFLLQSSGGKWQGFIVPQISLCSAVFALLKPSDLCIPHQPKVTSVLNSIANVNGTGDGEMGVGRENGRERENVTPYDGFYHPPEIPSWGLEI